MWELRKEVIPTRVETDPCKKAGGFAPSTPTGEPPEASSLRGTKVLVPRSDEASGGSPVGVEGAKPPAFLDGSVSTWIGIKPSSRAMRVRSGFIPQGRDGAAVCDIGVERLGEGQKMELIGSLDCGSIIAEMALALAGVPCTITDIPYLKDGPERQRLLELNPLG